MLGSSASAAVLQQYNDSTTSKNFTSDRSAQNFTAYLNVPANSSISATWLGSIRSPAYEVISSKDLIVTNFSGFRDFVSTTPQLTLTYPADQARTNFYIYFNTTLDMSQYGSVQMVLPYQSPGAGDVVGDFNITIYEVFENATDWSESTLTWNNQPCGVAHTPNGTFCNTTYADKVQVLSVSSTDYNCSSDRLLFNITSSAIRRKSNVSFLVEMERNASYTGIINAIDFCSKETGFNLYNNQSFPTQPSLYFGSFVYPSNVTVFINNSVANMTTTLLNSSNRWNLTLNASLSDNLSRYHHLSVIPVTFQIGGPGIVEVSSIAWTYQVNGLAAALFFNTTSPYVLSWSQGSATFVKEFSINNSGTADAKNCTIELTVNGGDSLLPYISYPNNFSVVNQSSTKINVSIIHPPDGSYDNNVNFACGVEGNNETFITSSPVQFSFSISSPSASNGGGGGGITVLDVTNTSITLSPRLADLFYIRYPTSNGDFSFTTYSNVKITKCEAQTGFTCSISEDGTSATLHTSIPAGTGISSTIQTQIVITGNAGQVGVVPVRISVIYVGFPTIALGIAGILGAAWVIKKGR